MSVLVFVFVCAASFSGPVGRTLFRTLLAVRVLCTLAAVLCPVPPVSCLLIITVGSGKLFRKTGLSAREGSRRDSASHGTHSACATGSAGRSAPLPNEGPMRIRCALEECCAHSFCAGAVSADALRHGRRNDGERPRRCATWPRWPRSVSQVSLRVARHASSHDSLSHHTAWMAC